MLMQIGMATLMLERKVGLEKGHLSHQYMVSQPFLRQGDHSRTGANWTLD